jgi:hypothetical protein
MPRALTKTRLTLAAIGLTVVSMLAVLMLSGGKASALPINGAPSDFFPDTYTANRSTSAMVQLVPGGTVAMKARSTLMNIYVPTSSLGQPVSLTIIGGCDSGANSGRDINGWYANTAFYISAPGYPTAWADANCSGGNVNYTFTAAASATADDDANYYKYEFQADAFSSLGDATGTQYLNAFQVQAPAGVYLGVSNAPVACNSAAYPQSCPTPRPWPINGGGSVSLIYSSFYGQDNPYSQYLNIHIGNCSAVGIMSVYDLDASDAALNQTGLRMSITTIYDDGRPSPPVVSLNRAQIMAWNSVYGAPQGRPYIGGNEDQYLDIPAIGSATFPNGIFQFEPNTRYILEVFGLSNNNAFQMLPYMSPCTPIVGPSCAGLTPFSITNGGSATINPGDRIGFRVNVSGANGYQVGVNGPGPWGDEYPMPRTGGPTTDITNYLVTTNGTFARGSPVITADGTVTVNNVSYADGSPLVAPVPMVAPAAVGSYPFSWGLIQPGVGWANVTCQGVLNVGVTAACPGTNGPGGGGGGGASGVGLPGVRTETLASSADVTNQACHISLGEYASFRSQVSWPQRAEGCGGPAAPSANNPTGTPYKSLPWLAQNNGPVGGGTNGNLMNQVGNCVNRYWDGGTAGGAWLSPSALNGWANNISSFVGNVPHPGSSSKLTNCTANAMRIWGRSGVDQTDHSISLYRGNGWVNYVPQNGWGVYGNGTTIVRNNFNLTAAQISNLNLGATNLMLRAVADDWYRIYLNGVLVHTEMNSVVSSSVPLNGVKSILRVGVNSIAVQAVDKARWSQTPLGASTIGFGLCYSLDMDIPFDMPYVKAYGGDIRSCSNIRTWGGTDGSGAGAEYGVFAAGSIDGMSSAFLRNRTPRPPKGLTFANNLADTWGGNFGGASPGVSCQPNYWNDLRSAPVAASGANIDLSASGQVSHTGGTVLRAQTTSSRITVFVDGDLKIDGNVIYAAPPGNASWASINDIPFVTVVVCGNIYIDSGVTNLMGWYIAITKSSCTGGPGGGTIYTCTTNGGQVIADALRHNQCRNQLTVRGSFTADRIKFQRTRGSQHTGSAGEGIGSGNIAEKFIYGAEMWLARPEQRPPESVPGGTRYESITSLPPIL